MRVLLLFGVSLTIVGALPQGISPEDFAPQNPDLIEPQYQERQSGNYNLTDIESIENAFGIKPDENGMYTLDDTMFTAEELLWMFGTADTERNAHPNPMARWPGSGNTKGVMPVIYDSTVSQSLKTNLLTQINRFNQQMVGCLSIVDRTSQSDYVKIQAKNEGCYSSRIGRGGGMQRINIQNPGCTSSGTIVHEFIHALGFWHEQSRPDRDSYVTILWQNIKDGKSHNFNKQTNSIEHGPYDGKSVMHYRSTAFTKNGQRTIEVKPGVGFTASDLGQRIWMTDKDAQKLRKMYGCDATPGPATTTSAPGSGCHTGSGGWSCCSSSNQCGKGEGDCDKDSDCKGNLKCGTDNCDTSLGFTSSYDCCTDSTGPTGSGCHTGSGGWSCCSSSNQCGVGEGDCDKDSDCSGSLKCGTNNCDASLGFGSHYDCCYDSTGCHTGSGGWSCCSSSNQCGKGEGDCDSDADCQGSLKCGTNNCDASLGFGSHYDCCY